MIGEFFPISGFEDKVDLFQCTGGEGEEEEVLNTVAKAGSAGELKRVSVGWIAPEGFQASVREEAACFPATVAPLFLISRLVQFADVLWCARTMVRWKHSTF